MREGGRICGTLQYITFTPGFFRVQPCTAPCSSSSSICTAHFGAGEQNHTYSFVGQPTDKNKLRRSLLRCIHDRLAFDMHVSRAALNESSCRKCMLPNLHVRTALINSLERVWSIQQSAHNLYTVTCNISTRLCLTTHYSTICSHNLKTRL